LSPSFLNVLATDGITLKYVPNLGLAVSQKTNFSPRLGFAYQINPKLVMRGGYGIFYGGFENRGYGPNIGENYPFQFQFSYGSPNGETPTHVPGSTISTCGQNYTYELGFTCTPLESAVVLAEGLGPHGLEYKYKTPYTQGWNLTFQYELTPTMTLSLGYVGNTVRHLETGPNANNPSQILPPGTCLAAPTCPPQTVSYVPFPDFSTGFSYITTQRNSYYHSLQLSVEKHYANGVNFPGNLHILEDSEHRRGPPQWGGRGRLSRA
jgi:hypothetical protein